MSNGNRVLPSGWIEVSLNQACCTITDGTHKTPNYQDAGVRFISIKNIRPFIPINWNSYVKFISEEEHGQLTQRCKPEYDDILFPRIGTLGFAKRIDFNEKVSIFVGLGLLKPIKQLVLPKYLEFYMNTPMIYHLSHKKANGSGRLTLPLEESRLFPLPIAPIKEQQRIVDKIEELLSCFDAGITSLERVKANLKRYRASVLKSAVEGKLTEQWRANNPPSEPASNLLERILDERRQKWEDEQLAKFAEKGQVPPNNWKGKYKEPVRPDTTNLPSLPEGWCYTHLSTVIPANKTGTKTGPFGSLLKKHEHQEDGIPVFGIENISRMRFTEGSKIHITNEKAQQLSEYDALPGDILISRSGTVGEVCVVPEGLGDARISTNLMRVRLISDFILPEFFCLLFNGSPFVLSQVKKLCSGSTRDFLNTEILMSIIFPLPSITEQRIIVKEVENALSQIQQTDTLIGVIFRRASRLRQSILKRAFEGKLVPQDPNDEPASVLLERIKAERQANDTFQKAKKQPRKKAVKL